MKTEKLNSWLTLGANVGVLVGLILLVYEIRQNSDLMRAEMMQSRGDAGSQLLQWYMDSPYIPAIIAKLNNNQKLSDEESIRYSYYFRSAFRNMDSNYWQYTRGFLGSEVPTSLSVTGKMVIARGGIGLEIWDQYKYGYSDEFVAFIDEAIADLR